MNSRASLCLWIMVIFFSACDKTEEPVAIPEERVSKFTLYDAETGTQESVYDIFYNGNTISNLQVDSDGATVTFEWHFEGDRLLYFTSKYGSSCAESSTYEYTDTNHILITRKDCETYDDTFSIYLNDEDLSEREYWYEITPSGNDTIEANEYTYENGDIIEVYDLLYNEVVEEREYTGTLVPENIKFVYSQFNLLNAGHYHRKPRHLISKYVSYYDHTIYYKIEYEFDEKGNIKSFTTHLSDFTEDNYQPWYRVEFEYESVN